MTYKFGTNYGRIGTARSANLQAYYKFDGDLTDSSGNGFTMSLSTGTETYTSLPWGYKMAKFDGATRFEKSAETEFEITGAFTMHMLLTLDTIQPSAPGDWIGGYGENAVDSPSTNQLYSLIIDGGKYLSFTEHTGGTNIIWTAGGNCLPVVGHPVFVTQTRDVSGNVGFYINGVSMGVTAGSGYPAAPTGGDSVGCSLFVGGQDAGSSTPTYFKGAMAELQILNTELTPAQVLEDAKKVMPWL